jgi:pimeloyl-[acyl-carrier protein] methyl ester esterase
MAALHVDDYAGSGEPLLFIHGWGMHGGMWGDALSQLAKQHRLLAVDLPGHGFSAVSGKWKVVSGQSAVPHTYHSPLTTHHFHLDDIVDALSAQFTEPLTVCGWSLGGQIAMRWAMRHPDQVSRLVLVSSTPCFVQRADWSCAMNIDVLAAFSTALQQDYAATLRRFLALQVRGGEQEREQLASLRNSLMSRGEPDLAALKAGLEILRDVDLRAVLPQLCQNTLVIAGARDTLTPLSASQYLAAHLPVARLAAIEGASHAPFLSHPDEFVKHVVDFLHE